MSNGVTVPGPRSWHVRVVALLCERKAHCASFDSAWDETMRKVGPYLRGSTVERVQRLFVVEGEDVQEPTMEEFTRQVCEDAWHGRKPQLREFTLDALRESDSATAAPRAGMIGAAA